MEEISTTDLGRVANEAFAPYYDAYTAGYRAEKWTGSLAALARRHGLTGKRLLDVGCGTGKSAAPMAARGFEVVGCDISPAMLEIANDLLGPGVRLGEADVRSLPVFGAFDLVWALNDVLNYMLSPHELRLALEGMRENLAEGGVLLFDLNTLLLHRASFTGEGTREEGGHTLSWIGMEEEVVSGALCEGRIEINGVPSATHVHRQRHFAEVEVRAVIAAAGLSCVGVYGDYEGEQDQPLDETRHQKAIYIVQRAAHSPA